MAFLYVLGYAVIGLVMGMLLWGVEDEEDAVGWMLLWPWFTLICVTEAAVMVLRAVIMIIRREQRKKKSEKRYRKNQKNVKNTPNAKLSDIFSIEGGKG